MRAATNDLNNLLQGISESSEVLMNLCRGSRDAENSLDIIKSSVDRAATITGGIAERMKGAHAGGTVHHPAGEIKPTPPAVASGEIHNPGGPRELILFVDDDSVIRLLVVNLLTAHGYRVAVAPDGPSAIELYQKLKNDIALVILDFAMPVMDGADVFDELQRINPDVPVVLSSGFAEHDRLRSMLAKGLRGFIPKPYGQDKLLSQIQQTLDAIRLYDR